MIFAEWEVRRGVFSWLQSADSLLDVAKSGTLDLIDQKTVPEEVEVLDE